MSADTENILKPKAELIKRPKDSAGPKSGAAPEDGNKTAEPERKKVVKVRKKPAADSAASPGASPGVASNITPSARSGGDAAVPEKPAVKVKVVARVNTAQPSPQPSSEIDPAAPSQPGPASDPAAVYGGGGADKTLVRTDSSKPDSPQPGAVTPAAEAATQAAVTPVPDTPPQTPAFSKKTANVNEKSGGNKPAGAGSHVSVYKETARPAVQAGRVGGKFIGPKPPRGANHNGGAGHGENRGGGAYSGGHTDGGHAGGSHAGGVHASGGHALGGHVGGNRNDGRRPASYVGHGGTNTRRAGSGFTAAPGQGGANHNNYSGGRPYPSGGGGTRPPYGGGGQGGSFRPSGYTPSGGYGANSRPGGAGRNAAPVPPADGKGVIKRTFKAKKPEYQRRDKELEMEKKHLQSKKRLAQAANPVPKSIDIMEVVSVSELARKMNLKASDLIAKLMSMGQMVTINQQIDSETAAIIAAEFGSDVNIVSLYDETLIETEADDVDSMTPRPPVVTVMGHVDHGKTKLLDAIRSADVVSGEFGGITQHIGAYMVETVNGSITFLDTPGHEAFTRMRSRGAQVTDVVILVVAADDGVMPQTIEAINHAKEADVPIIVAINKIDKPEANPDKVRSQLSDLGLQPEEWGGQTMFVELSALKKEGLDKLIDAILLQAEMLDLRVNYNRNAEGKILESRIDHGRGIVATVLVEKGALEIGDSFVAGIWPGKVRAIFNDKGIRIERALPAMPVEVLGFEGIPNAGDPLQVVEDEKTARSFSAKRQELKRFEDAKNIRKITLDNLYDTISDGEIQELKVIIKGDVQGSVEALRASLEKLSTKEVRLAVIQSLPGAINEGDVDLASASNAILIGFNVRPTPKAKSLADQEKVDIRRYNIIYRVVEDMQKAMEGLLKPDTKEEIIANVEVREVFKISKTGVIAGCYVHNGTVKRGASVNVIRNDTVIYTGKIASLRRFKDDVKEVAASFECGMSIEGFDDIKAGDEFEVFEIVEIVRKL